PLGQHAPYVAAADKDPLRTPKLIEKRAGSSPAPRFVIGRSQAGDGSEMRPSSAAPPRKFRVSCTAPSGSFGSCWSQSAALRGRTNHRMNTGSERDAVRPSKTES